MIKKAYDNGALAALTRFGLEKLAVGLMPTMMAKGRQFARGQAGALGQLGTGLKGMLGPTANPGARTQAWEGLKGIAPTLGGAAALGIGAHMLGDSDEDKMRKQMQMMGR